jgi:hypothetical protein
MPATVTTPKVRHEEFCPVVDKGQEPRLESFDYIGDDPTTNRSRPTHHVTRCLDCGAATYRPIGA